jgi:nucleoid-associated protein YgaU
VALAKLQIVAEAKNSRAPQITFDDSSRFAVMFNPDELSFSKSANWASKEAKGRDVPELQFTKGEPRTLTIKLFFDTYDTPDPQKDDVRKFTDRVLHLTTVEKHGDTHRPPVLKLSWGGTREFKCVLERLEQKYTLFMEDGTPVRATLTCTFKEWRTNTEDQRIQATMSADIAKSRVVRRGDTLSGLAADEYLDPGLWRPIAVANHIDDPLRLLPGSRVVVPKLPLKSRPFSR